MTSGERLRLFRKNKGLNQTQISKILNILPRNWSRYETDKTSPPQDVLVNLAKIGLDIHWYMTGESENRVTNYPFAPENITQSDNKLTNSHLPDTVAGGMIKSTSGKGGPPGASATEAGERNTMAVLEGTGTPIEALREIARRGIPVVVDGGVEQGLLIPVIAQGLSAGLGHDYDEGETIRYIKVPAWVARSGRDLVALPVYGDSMEPTISNGDLVVITAGVPAGKTGTTNLIRVHRIGELIH